MARKAATTPPEETPEQREARIVAAKVARDAERSENFVRLAKQRMTNALYRVGQVGALGGPQYLGTEEQKAKIVTALRNAVTAVEDAFKPKAGGSKEEFDF
jgi:hypothetical protein